ncbi:hypothetical protein KY334_04940 [Candidatus Woesearchaeota archaeon]|nr:hypothetical protein [Candidatus Woesearchaeota archaeon]
MIENLETKVIETTDEELNKPQLNKIIVQLLRKGRVALKENKLDMYEKCKDEFSQYAKLYEKLFGEPYIVRKKDYINF